MCGAGRGWPGQTRPRSVRDTAASLVGTSLAARQERSLRTGNASNGARHPIYKPAEKPPACNPHGKTAQAAEPSRALGCTRAAVEEISCVALQGGRLWQRAGHRERVRGAAVSGRPAPEPGGGGRRDGARNAGNTHCTARAEPFTVWYFWQRRVQAVEVVGGRAGVAAQQLPSVLTDPAELHVVILLLLAAFLFILLLLLRLPLDALLLLGKHNQRNTEGFHQPPAHTHRPLTPLTQWGQLHLPSGAFSSSGSRQTRW